MKVFSKITYPANIQNKFFQNWFNCAPFTLTNKNKILVKWSSLSYTFESNWHLILLDR